MFGKDKGDELATDLYFNLSVGHDFKFSDSIYFGPELIYGVVTRKKYVLELVLSGQVKWFL